MSDTVRKGLVWSLLAITASAFAGSRIEPRAALAACDNECRIKDSFKYCASGKCTQFLYATCMMCGGLGNATNGRCTNDGAVILQYCNTRTGGNTAYSYDDCDAVCSCTGFDGFVEASFMGYTGSSLPCSYLDCMGAPIQGEN